MNGTKPIVSICCITYNHDKYIRDAVEGFLMQETTFPIEIIIHDDASTDKTAEIIKSYAEKHTDLIFPILQAENQYSKGISISTYVHPKARGKYAAYCEGDDYWTDPHKLQKQVEFMESNPDCSWCFHAARNVYVDGKGADCVNKPKKIPKNGKFTAKDVIQGGGGFFASASSMFRAHVLKDLPDWFFSAPIGDFPLALIASSKGDVGYIDDVMCVYRDNVPGSWSSRKRENETSWTKNIDSHKKELLYLQAFNAYSCYRYEKYIKKRVVRNKCALFLRFILIPIDNPSMNERHKRLEAINITPTVCYQLKFTWILLSFLANAFVNKSLKKYGTIFGKETV